MESEDFVISDLDFACEFLSELLLLLELNLELTKHLMVLLAPLVSFSHFKSPLVLVDEHGLLHLKAGGNSIDSGWTHSTKLLRHTFTFIASFLDSVSHLNALLIAL